MNDNPFRYGALALDEAFTDREEEIRELTADIRNGQDVVVFGPRRYGKTSLVWRVSRDLIARGVLVAHVDLMTAPTKQLLAEKLARTIHADVASRLERARERALQVFRGLRVQPRITIDPDDGSVSFAFDTARTPADVDATLERLLELPGELAAERRRKVALVLDEFQEITDIDPHLPKLLRAVFQTQPEVAHVYLGSKRHLLQRIFNDANEPFWRSAKQMELGLIPVPRFREFLRARFAVTGKRVDDAVLEPMLALTHGHPYATQELAYFVWEQSGSRKRVTESDLRLALDHLLRSEHAHFSLLWEESSRDQRLLLLALADGPGRPYSADFAARNALPAATNVQKALTALTRRELAGKQADGSQAIVEPFLAEWLRRTQR
jgi:uncharacterized protein